MYDAEKVEFKFSQLRRDLKLSSVKNFGTAEKNLPPYHLGLIDKLLDQL